MGLAGFDEPGEQGMRLERLRFELGVELHRDVPGVGRELDNLDELTVERPASDLESLLGQRLLVEAVELVAMAVPLLNHILAVELA